MNCIGILDVLIPLSKYSQCADAVCRPEVEDPEIGLKAC